jgi:hypothetical protein
MVETEFDGLVDVLQAGYAFLEAVVDLGTKGGIDPVDQAEVSWRMIS